MPFRSSSEERVLDSPTDVADTIRRVSSHEDFNSQEHLHILSQLGQDMGHGVVSATEFVRQSVLGFEDIAKRATKKAHIFITVE